MTRTEVRTLIETGINTLVESYAYGGGRISEWNSDRGRSYPMIWLDEETFVASTSFVNFSLPVNDWEINLHIARKDAVDSIEDQYVPLIDDCDLIAQKLIKNYNAVVSDSDTISITGISRTPFIKKNADCLTGVVLSFTLNAPDKTNLC
jgi:hypothetical protein